MTVVGVVLIILVALVVAATLLGGSDAPVLLDLGLFDVSTSAMGVFLIGAATALIFASGLELMRLGMGRSLNRRRELRRARAVVAEHERREQQTADSGATEADTQAEPAPGSETGAQTDRGTDGDGAHKAARGDPTLPGKQVGTDPDVGGGARST
jgi:hypothetical protein